ncbi:MAG: hypothetical protein AMXMBFR53_26460 [Gemmatimonadota bacterium]
MGAGVSRCCLILTCLGAFSCAPADDRPVSVQRDSAGVQIIESMEPLWASGEGWSVDSLPLMDLAKGRSGPEYEFFQVRDAARLDDGRVAVANYGTSEVRVYGSDGRFHLSSGGAGQGPGEFQRLTSVQPYRGDSLVAFDYWAKRVTLLDSAGAVARVTSLFGQEGSLTDLYALSEGQFLLQTAAITEMANAQGRMRVPAPLVLLAADGTVVDTLAVVAGFETYVFDRGDARPPLSRRLHVAARDSLVYIAEGDYLGFQVRAVNGTLSQIVRLPAYDLEVPVAVRDSIRAAMLGQELPPPFRPVMEAMANSIPTRRPASSGLTVDALGYVWLQEYVVNNSASGPRRWLVFEPNGEWLGHVSVPPSFDLYEVGEDFVLGRSLDAMGVETVQVLRLHRQ